MSSGEVHILLVEDDDVDAEAVVRGFQRAKIANPIRRAKDGLHALNVLRGEGDEPPIPRPYLILLDLKLPRMDGLAFLDEIRRDDELGRSIVFVLTTSNEPRDRREAYEKHIAGYIVKSRVGADFLELVHLLDTYWRIVEFPTPPELERA